LSKNVALSLFFGDSGGDSALYLTIMERIDMSFRFNPWSF
jgi:hypothetical protein